jgi:hypothetical protein
MRRISLRDGMFSNNEEAIECVIVNAAKVSRAYFSGEFDPDKLAAPTCWSSTTQTPDPDVPEDQVQSRRCMDCPQNVRGSSGAGRACRFSQRVAVVMLDDLERVYQIQLPATSIFGKTVGGNMPLQAYAKFLSEHNTTAISIVTKIYFDLGSAIPKVFFKPVRPLEEADLNLVTGLVNHPDTIEAITLPSNERSATSSPFGIVEGYEHPTNHS